MLFYCFRNRWTEAGPGLSCTHSTTTTVAPVLMIKANVLQPRILQEEERMKQDLRQL
jgi:hypothetical protein